MKARNYIYILLTLFAISGCNREEWLDIKPTGVVIPTKVSDYRLLLDQVLTRGISPGFANSYANIDMMADEFEINDAITNFTGKLEKRAYQWSDDFYDPNEEDGDWATLYGQIYVTNIVTEEILDATGDMDEKLQLQAEAKVQNAYAYFCLVNQYAVHYNPSTAATDLAVPLRLDSNIEGVQLPRATVQEIYDLILENLTTSIDALPDLPENEKYKNRPTKAGAYAFLSRIYLYMGKYDEALDAANSALALHNELLNYNDLGDYYGTIDMPKQQFDPEILWFKQSTSTYRMLVIAPELYNSYDEGDQRLRRYGELEFLFGIPGDAYVFSTPYFVNFRFTGFSVAEMLLTRAECNARKGETALALNDINRLRSYRITPDNYVALASTDQDEVLEWVLFERKLELVGQGQRFFDLKRYNQFDNANISLTHTVEGSTVTLAPGSKNWAVPVAQKYILETPEIGENIRD